MGEILIQFGQIFLAMISIQIKINETKSAPLYAIVGFPLTVYGLWRTAAKWGPKIWKIIRHWIHEG